jgi:hypothetical protein
MEHLIPIILIPLGGPLWAQEPTKPPPTTPQQEQAKNATGSTGTVCLEPPPMVRWQDYNGPFAKLVGTVGGKVERKAINLPNYKPGEALCSLGVKDKFVPLRGGFHRSADTVRRCVQLRNGPG